MIIDKIFLYSFKNARLINLYSLNELKNIKVTHFLRTKLNLNTLVQDRKRTIAAYAFLFCKDLINSNN